MTIDLRPMPHPMPVPAKRPSKQSRNFVAIQVTLPRARLRGKRDRDEAVNLSLPSNTNEGPRLARQARDEPSDSLIGLPFFLARALTCCDAPANVCVAASHS